MAAALWGCPSPYDAPPEIGAINLDRGLYDPAKGPLSIELSEPVDKETLEVSVLVSRRGLEGGLCPSDGSPLPAGCREPARAVFGPCRPALAAAMRDGDGARYECSPAGALRIDAASSQVVIDVGTRLVPYERYSLLLSPGLTDAAGRVHKKAIEVDFEVAGDIPHAPTDFASGTFFAELETISPVAAQFHFFIHLRVRPETGEVLMIGADADPKDPATDMKVNRDPLAWFPDIVPGTGATIRATGQVAGATGDRALVIYPFRLLVPVPPVDAPDVELRGTVRMSEAGTPPSIREVVEGGLFASQIFLGVEGEKAALGEGSGRARLFRMTAEESPSLESLLPAGVTLAQALEGWE